MQFSGTVEIKAPREKVWAFVTDPNQVGTCGPGLDSIEVVDATHFRIRAKVGAGFFGSKVVVDLEIVDQDPPNRAVIKAHGQASGTTVDATATMTLRDGPDHATTMDWSADIAISGSLAGLGTRLIEGSASKSIGQVFDCVKAKLEA